MNVRVSAAALAAGAVATLSACHASSKTAGAPATPTNTKVPAAAESATSNAAPTSAPATSAAPAAAAKSIDICTAVPPATVVQLTGKPYTVATPGTIGVGVSCAYDDVDTSDDGVTLSYATSNADSTWQAVHTGNITDVSGVGDKAFWDNENTLYAVSGSTIIQVNGLSAQAPTVALAKAFLNALH